MVAVVPMSTIHNYLHLVDQFSAGSKKFWEETGPFAHRTRHPVLGGYRGQVELWENRIRVYAEGRANASVSLPAHSDWSEVASTAVEACLGAMLRDSRNKGEFRNLFPRMGYSLKRDSERVLVQTPEGATFSYQVQQKYRELFEVINLWQGARQELALSVRMKTAKAYLETSLDQLTADVQYLDVREQIKKAVLHSYLTAARADGLVG